MDKYKKFKYIFLFFLLYYISYYYKLIQNLELSKIYVILLLWQLDSNNVTSIKKLEPIKLYYSANKYVIPNAGDYYGKWLLEKMGYRVQYSNKPEIIVCGSILAFNKYLDINTKVWGVGFHNEDDVTIIKNSELFYAVRGKLTLKKLNINYNIALGDPGLLLSKFFKPLTKRVYDICIISHYLDYKWFRKNYGDKYFIINMGCNNIEEIANSINKCNFVFSSSLHGIIFSHSLGIPAIHLENKRLHSKNNFKFKDYYSILDIPYIKEDLKNEKLENIIKKYKKNRYKYLPSNKIIKRIQDNLLFNFPYRKMNKVIYTINKY